MTMDEKDKELQALRREIADLKAENERLKQLAIELKYGKEKQ